MRDALRGAQTLKTLWVPQHLATLLAQRDDLACHLLLSGHADLKDLLGFLASGKTAASREAQGDASRILGLPHTVWLGDPKKRCDGIGAERQADVLAPEGLGGLKLEGKRGVTRQASSA